MPDFNNFAGRGFREGRFRDVGGGAPGSGGNVPPQRKKLDWKKLGRRVLIVFLVLLILSAVFGSYYNVSEQQNAVVTMFGKVVRTDTAGLYFKIPFLWISPRTAPASAIPSGPTDRTS